jgi:hypothetical protein
VSAAHRSPPQALPAWLSEWEKPPARLQGASSYVAARLWVYARQQGPRYALPAKVSRP